MKLSRFYDLVVRFGKDRDVRSKQSVNFFEDSRILYGDPDTEVKKILVGIDIEVADLLLADRLRQRQGLDLVVSHHPEGIAYASLYKVMRLQIDVLKKSGLKEVVARKLLEERMLEVQRKIMPQNHTRPVDAAVLLNLPFIVENYKPWQRERLKVKPGITGIWQIVGRKDMPLKDNIEYDFYYIYNRSLILDVAIILKSLPVIIMKKGAY